MSAVTSFPHAVRPRVLRAHRTRRSSRPLLVVALFIVAFVVLLPVAAVLARAFEGGLSAYFRAITTSETVSALSLTLKTAAIVVPLNTAFGLAAGWALGRFRFRGHTLLRSAIELPLAVSPVVSGLAFVVTLGPRTPVGAWLEDHGVRVIFAPLGIALATVFVTFPYVAREVIGMLEAGGRDEEEAALSLGASGLQTFFRITLPRIKWALFYGIVLCNARAMGEFGAVSVVSGHVRNGTNTLPLHVEALYQDSDGQGAHAVASLLVLLAVVTLVGRALSEQKRRRT